MLGRDGRASTNRVIVLTCFGRGGSGIVWRMIGSSPDVIMTNDEWHVGVFGTRKALRKGVPLAFRSLGIESLEPLRRYAFRKTLEMQRPNDVSRKTRRTEPRRQADGLSHRFHSDDQPHPSSERQSSISRDTHTACARV